MTTRTEALPELLARIPDQEIRALFTPAFILCSEHFDRFTVDVLLKLVRELELEPLLREGATVTRLREARGYAPRASAPLAWILGKLASEDYLDVVAREPEPTYRARGPIPVGDPDRAERQAQAIDPASMPAFAVVRTTRACRPRS